MWVNKKNGQWCYDRKYRSSAPAKRISTSRSPAVGPCKQQNWIIITFRIYSTAIRLFVISCYCLWNFLSVPMSLRSSLINGYAWFRLILCSAFQFHLHTINYHTYFRHSRGWKERFWMKRTCMLVLCRICADHRVGTSYPNKISNE